MGMNGEERLECEVHVDVVIKYMYIWDLFWTKQVQMGQNVVGRWQVGRGWQVPKGP